MDLCCSIVNICLLNPISGHIWNPISQQIGYIKDLYDNMDTLDGETHDLKIKRDAVRAQVDTDESAGMTPLSHVRGWLGEADSAVADVDSIRLEVDRMRSRCCCVYLNSRCRLGERVSRKINAVKRLKDEGNFTRVAESPRGSQMEVPQELEQQRTSKEAMEEITQWLKDEVSGVICVWGMGGVDKTTLAKGIYNRFDATKDFHQVIWVPVSKDLNLEAIQKKIGEKLELQFRGGEDVEEKRDRLNARLRNIRYLLILDDLWRDFTLGDVGIPQPSKENRCKIVITTRLNEVSNAMGADRQIKIKPLGSEEAWHLFRSKTGDVIFLPEIKPLAEKVVKECGGLPLAIVTVGRAMRPKVKKELWQDALRALKGSAPEIRSMEREVFLPLKLSYDCLEDPKIQACFLYCSLYPEDYHIDVEELITFWAFEEGLVTNVNSLEEAQNKGHRILATLTDACLLEEDGWGVRMHDLVRDLALWITSPSSSSCLQASKFLVKAGKGLEHPPEEKMWEGMQRISLMNSQITELQMIPNCPDLVSLFLRGNRLLHTIGGSFFQFMPKLQVLDLWGTDIMSLPSSLSQLVNLRVLLVACCQNLQEMPPLGELKELQLLDLSRSGVENLPQGIASLAKLKYLELSHTYAVVTIPGNIFSGLTPLEHLGLVGGPSRDIWREIVTLPRLNSLSIVFNSYDASMEDVCDHPIWSRLSSFLVYVGSYDRDLGSQLNGKVLDINLRDIPSQILSTSMMQNAEHLYVEQSQGLESLSQIIGNSASLRFIKLAYLKGMKCVVDWSKAGVSNALDRLEELFVESLPCLEKVFHGGPPTGLQQLRKISIFNCPKLMFICSSTDLQFLHQLEELVVINCEEIEEIVERGHPPDSTLQRPRILHLHGLPKLTTICSQQLVLTSMECIEIDKCPKLKKLPVLCPRIQDINGYIRGSREWWEGIEWEDEHSKSLYSTIYQKTGRRDNL